MTNTSHILSGYHMKIIDFVTDAVWNREENRQFRENREHILALMEHLNIVARPILYPEDEERDDDVWPNFFHIFNT